ncbi:MAG: Gfo/Idh/MocA family protein [bacterium]
MLKVGIIGLGVGEKHIAGYQSHQHCKVTALCDFSTAKRRSAQIKYPDMRVTANADELIEDENIDVISIASYDNFHYEQITSAIENNKHVFVEKPLCLFESEARHIKRKLDENPHLKMSSNLILRRSPRFVELKQMVEEDYLGEIFSIEGDYNYGRLTKITDGWRGRLDFYSVIQGGGIHIVDLLLWLTNDKVIEVAAFGNRISSRGTRFKHHDMVMSILRFEHGSVGKVTANFGCVFPHFHRLALYGTRATFIHELSGARCYTSRNPEIAPREIETAYPGVAKGDLLYDFIDAIINDSRPEIGKDDVFKSMSVCFAIEKASQKNETVRVDYI